MGPVLHLVHIVLRGAASAPSVLPLAVGPWADSEPPPGPGQYWEALHRSLAMRAAHDDAQAQAVPLSPELARCMEAGLRRVPGQRSGGSAGVGETSEVQAWEAPHEVVRTRIKLSELQRPSTTAAKQRPLATVPHESPPNVSDASPSIDRETGHDASSPVAGRKDTPQRRGGSSPRQPSQRGAAEATFDAGELFDALDRNKDGVVDRIEFEVRVAAVPPTLSYPLPPTLRAYCKASYP